MMRNICLSLQQAALAFQWKEICQFQGAEVISKEQETYQVEKTHPYIYQYLFFMENWIITQI